MIPGQVEDFALSNLPREIARDACLAMLAARHDLHACCPDHENRIVRTGERDA